MPSYKASGTEPLRSRPTTKHAAEPEQPSTSGKDVGGRSNPRAETRTLSSGNPSTPKGSYGHKVEGIQEFGGGSV